MFAYMEQLSHTQGTDCYYGTTHSYRNSRNRLLL